MSETMTTDASDIRNAYFEANVNQKVSRWRVFQFILFLPLAVISILLYYITAIIYAATLITVPFIGRVPKSFYNAIIAIERYRGRIGAFLFFFLSSWPPFKMPKEKKDPGDYPVSIHYPEYPGRTPRWGPLGIILVIPHILWIWLLGIVWMIRAIIAFFSVLFLGKIPQSYIDFSVGFSTYTMRVGLYISMINMAHYPLFSLKR